MQENTPFRRRGAKIENIGFGYEKEKALKQNVSELSTWQREKDLNPHIRSQSPLCYPYTIPLDTFVIIPAFADLSRETEK